MDGGKQPQGVARNTFKSDYTLFIGGGFGGGGSLVPTVVSRYTYWIDHNPFATFIRRLITQNVSFEICTDAAGLNPVDLYVSFDQSNDRPDEMFTDATEIAAGRVVKIPKTILPPYYFTTTTIKQPVDPRSITDQGNFVYSAYNVSKSGTIVAKTGTCDFVCESFVPTSPQLVSLFLRDLFRVGSLSDHTLYRNLIVEIWDANRNFYANAAIVPSAYSPHTSPNSVIDANGTLITTVTDHFTTADDSLLYWTEIEEVRLKFARPIKVTPGATYYIVVRHTSPTAAALYAVGNNANSAGNYAGAGRYIFGQAYVGTGVAGSNTISSVGTDIDLCFTTQRNVARTAPTFYWGNPAYYWAADPAVLTGQFQFVKEDFDEVV